MRELSEVKLVPLDGERLQRLQKSRLAWERYRNLFETEQSWKWFIRTRKDALTAVGALVKTTAGDMIDPVLLEEVLPRLLTQTDAIG